MLNSSLGDLLSAEWHRAKSRRSRKLLAAAGAVLGLAACGSSDSSDSSSTSSGSTTTSGTGGSALAVDLAFCEDVQTVQNGRLCAIKPSNTDPAISDANGTGKGFGYHLVGVPTDWNQLRGVWVHFVGSYGQPYAPKDGTVNSKAWFNEALGKNYLLIVVAYENSKSINGDICTCSNGANGCQVDNCAGDVRREILDGVDHSSLVSVSSADGVDNRLRKLAGYLKSKSLALPPGFDEAAIDWSQIMVSGHSQGAGHAYYLAKNTGVKGACFFSGPFDNADMQNATVPIADWFVSPSSLSDPNKMGAIVATTDPYAKSFLGAWKNYMGLVENQQWFEYPTDATTKLTSYDGNPLVPTDPNDVHGSTVGAVELGALRSQACFTSAAHIQ